MTNITINYKKNTIEITKSFEKKASAYGSPEYTELANARKEFPNYRIIVKSTKTKSTFKGMDYDFMREYIEKHDNAEENMNGFNKLHEKNLTYGEIKEWFIDTYPVFKDCVTRAQWILAA